MGRGESLLGLGGQDLPQQLCLCQASRIWSQSFGLGYYDPHELDGPNWPSTLALTSELHLGYLPSVSSGFIKAICPTVCQETLQSLLGPGVAFLSLAQHTVSS